MLGNTEQLVLLDEPKALLQAGNIEGFLNNYGTHFIKTLNYGCDASATIYQYECSSSEAADRISASLSLGFFGQTAEGKTKIDNYLDSKTCSLNFNWYTIGTIEGITLPAPDQMKDANIMSQFWADFSAHCSQQAKDQGQLLYVTLGNWLEIPAVHSAIGNNRDSKNLLSFWASMDQQSMQQLGQAGRYLTLVQTALDNLADPRCKGALNPWLLTNTASF